MAETAPANELLADPLLRDVPTIEGFKVLGQVALYGKVGQGGMGVVYRARHCLLQVDMAVKCLKPSLAAEDPRFALRLVREAQVAAHISHQNVVRLYDANHQHGLHYIVMEFIDGENVRGRVQRKGRLSETEALVVLAGAAAGLAEAHRAGVVHRDIKPDNLLVSRAGRVKVADLGLVKREGHGGDSLSLASGVMGTPQYMAPEQWDTPDVGPAADVWALGASLYFMLVGEHAIEVSTLAAAARRVQEHDFPSLREKRPDLSPEVHALFERCVQRRAADRFGDAAALSKALQPLVRGGEDQLADAQAGQAGSQVDIVTPPTRAIIDRIREAISTKVAASQLLASEQQTVMSKGGTRELAPPPRARSRRWLPFVLTGVGVLGGVAWYGIDNHLFDSWFQDEEEWNRIQALMQARRLHEEAMKLLPEASGLEAAIAKLEEALSLRPDFVLAKTPLAQGLDKRAQLLKETDVDAAFVASSRSIDLDPTNAQAVARHDELRKTLVFRVAMGIAITSPKFGEVVAGTKFEVLGKVTAVGVQSLTLVAHRVGDMTSMIELQPSVVAGEFEAVVDVAEPGPCNLLLGGVDRHGVRGAWLPIRVIVPGVVGGGAPSPFTVPPPRIWNAAGSAMLPVAASTFVMGSPVDEVGRAAHETPREVTLTELFWLAETEVTRQQWMRVMNTSPWVEGALDAQPGTNPAIDISWPQAVEFCTQLTEIEREAGRLPDGYVYCLPTEAQWELAARAGAATAFAYGDNDEDLGEYAVFGELVSFPEPVAAKQANAFGLFDMAGNVAEWCADLAIVKDGRLTTFSSRGAVEPLGDVGEQHIHRGGSCQSSAADCRCAARAAATPSTATSWLGFRPALAKR